jgi:hypothetical protein
MFPCRSAYRSRWRRLPTIRARGRRRGVLGRWALQIHVGERTVVEIGPANPADVAMRLEPRPVKRNPEETDALTSPSAVPPATGAAAWRQGESTNVKDTERDG